MLHAPISLGILIVNACRATVEMDIFNVMLSMHVWAAQMIVTRTQNVSISVMANTNVNVTMGSQVMAYPVNQLRMSAQLNQP